MRTSLTSYSKDLQFSHLKSRLNGLNVRAKVPAVVHHDFTGRVQSVTEDLNPSYTKLLREFNAITGVPLLLNTSFNVMGKPIVHSIEDALAVFFTSGLDALVIEDYLIQK